MSSLPVSPGAARRVEEFTCLLTAKATQMATKGNLNPRASQGHGRLTAGQWAGLLTCGRS